MTIEAGAVTGGERRLHLHRPGGARALLAELARTFSDSAHRRLGPGFVESALCETDAAREAVVAFAAQCVPFAETVRAPSVAAWGRAIRERLLGSLREHDGPWRLHVFCADAPDAEVGPGRCRLVEEAVLEHLHEKQRRLLRTRVVDPAAPWAEREALVQVALFTAEEGAFSCCPPGVRHRLRRCLDRFPGGEVRIQRDPRPPSRAYAKLLEAEARLGVAIGAGETCVDLGASPGGWTFVALDRGARVTAVDRSPLRADLMANPLLEFVRGDAFAWRPPRPVDWLLCDVIAFPARSVELLSSFVAQGLCRRFVVTVKFRGDADLGALGALAAALDAAGAEFQLRQLAANKNEVTAYGTTQPRVSASPR